MLRYAASALVLTVLSSNVVCSAAAGNIGCLFSETLCNQKKEWCFNDVAFGKCLPLYGNVKEDDLHRFNFAAGDLHVLEGEMQRLYLLGYRWSHTYTQCVLQSVLRSVKNKSEFDISGCNAELDQDLEGALNAIEGEEMEHIDPRNLAIVRFTPSVADPHSDFADEFYYPPVDEMLPPVRAASGATHSEQEGTQERGGEEEQKGDQGKDSEGEKTEEQSGKGKDHSSNNKDSIPPGLRPSINENRMSPLHDAARELEDDIPFFLPQERPVEEEDDEEEEAVEMDPQDIINERLSLPPPALPMSLYLDRSDNGISPYDVSRKNYDYDLLFQSPYSTIPRVSPMYKRSKGFQEDFDNGREDIEELFNNLLRRYSFKGGDWRDLAMLLTGLGQNEKPEKPAPPANYPVSPGFFPSPGGQPDRNFNGRRIVSNSLNYFQEPPPNNPHRMNGRPEGQISYYSPYANGYPPSAFSKLEAEIPVLKIPDENDEEFPAQETLNPPYVKSDYDKPKESIPYDTSVARFDKDANPIYEPYKKPDKELDSYPWVIPDQVSSENSYSAFTDANNDYKYQYGYPRESVPPEDPSHGRPHPYPVYAYGIYDYRDFNDYNGYYDYGPDYVDPGSPTKWNLHRDERLDVKKPGPFFKSKNDFAFDYSDSEKASQDYIPGENDWIPKMDPLEGEAVLLTKLRQGQGLNKDGTKPLEEKGMKELRMDQFPDLLLTEEGYVQDGNEKGPLGFPKAASQIAPKNTGEDHIHSHKEPDSYVYISISEKFPSDKQAEQMVNIILDQIGLHTNQIQNFSVDKNQVMFQLKEDAEGTTAAHVAEKTEELRDVIKEKTGMEITQAGVGTKTAMSAVVYSSGKQEMLAAAAIVCGVCAALLVAATTLFFLRRHSRSKAKLQGITAHDTEASKDYQDLCRARMAGKGDGKDSLASGPGHAHPVGSAPSGHAPGHRISSLSKESDNGNNSPSSRSSTSSWSEEPVMSNMDISTGHMVLSYMEDHLRNKDRLEQEWVALCAYEAEPCTSNIALKPENAQKNRYQDALPYDHNRVILNEHTNVSGSNFINASSITDHDPRNPAYIATQGPLAATAADFWQLVWEQGSVVIVMLTRLTENGQALCHRYWPEEGSELYHIYEVHLVSEHIWCDDYLVRSFYLKNVRTGETRTVTQFHFLSWPESGIPASTKALLEFRRKVNKSYRGRSCPIIVHCSDGVGRTGTYCLIDMVLNRMSKGAKEIDIAATLEHIRDQRPNMVKTKAQFEFVLMSVAEEVHAILKALVQ